MDQETYDKVVQKARFSLLLTNIIFHILNCKIFRWQKHFQTFLLLHNYGHIKAMLCQVRDSKLMSTQTQHYSIRTTLQTFSLY